MSAITANSNGFGKSLPARAGATFPHGGEISRAVVNTIKQLYENPAIVLGRWLNVSDKQAKRKLSGEREFSVSELAILIRSERGFEVVAAIMGDANPEWWRICATLMDAADIRKMQIAAQKRIAKTLKGAIDADAELSAAIARSEALAFHDPDHMRPHLDALRSMAGLSDRAVASTAKSQRK
jgi:hypothetical protein